MGILSLGLLAAPLAGEAQPVLEQFRFDPPTLWTDRPIRVFHGTGDDLAPIEPCRAYVERLRRAGADAQISEYAGAHHAFDRPGAAPVRHNPREQNASRCFWEERSEGHLVNRDGGQPFSVTDPCVVLGGTFGPDPAAYRAALQAVKALVATDALPRP